MAVTLSHCRDDLRIVIRTPREPHLAFARPGLYAPHCDTCESASTGGLSACPVAFNTFAAKVGTLLVWNAVF